MPSPTALARPRYVAAFAALAFLIVVAIPGRRAALATWSELGAFRPRPHRVPLPADAARIGLRDVAFATAEGTRLRGWYAPARNRAAVLLVHGSGGDRRQLLDEARVLAGAGYGVLLFDLPGHGESEGRITFGSAERAAVRAALDFLTRRPDVDPDRVGVYGFSLGGYTAVQVAARDRRVRAVAIAGVPTDLTEQTRYEYRRGGRAAQWGALLAHRLVGLDVRTDRPPAVARLIAPRALFVAAGLADRTVPAAMAREIYAAAAGPKELWLIPGAGHGEYAVVEPTYVRRLRAFFDRFLLATRDADEARGVTASR